MQELSQVIESKDRYCLIHKGRQLKYVCMKENIDDIFMCFLCQLRGNSSSNVSDYLSIKEIQENDLKQPIENWPKDINHELMDHLRLDRSDCRQDMQVKIQTYFKQLQCNIGQSIELQKDQSLNILNSLYNELEQQQKNYNEFFQREKLHGIFEKQSYSNESFNELQQGVEEEKIKNLEYLEKRRKLADIFEKKIFQQPIEISKAVNYLLRNIDFFESEELRSIIPNYENLSIKDLSSYQSQIAEQTLYIINESCKLQQAVFESDKIMDWRKQKNTFEKQFDSYLYEEIQDIIKELKISDSNKFDQKNEEQKNHLIQELSDQTIKFNQKYTLQNIQSSIRKMDSPSYTQILKEIENIYKKTTEENKQFLSQNIPDQNIIIRTMKPLLDSFRNMYQNHQNFNFSLFVSNYGSRPQVQGYEVSSQGIGQVYLDISINPKLTYIMILKIHNFQTSRSLKFGILNTLFSERQFDRTLKSYCIDTNITYLSTLIRGNYITENNTPQYIEMRVNLEKQYLCISDYPENKNVISNLGQMSSIQQQRLAFGFGSNPSEQKISIEYLEAFNEFLKF